MPWTREESGWTFATCAPFDLDVNGWLAEKGEQPALVLLSASVSLTPFLLWLAIGYVALLVVDTGYAMRLSRSL